MDRIIGLKKGNIEIGLLLKKGNIGEEVEKELSLNVSNSHIPVSGLKEDLHKMRTCDREFIVNFTLFLVGKLIYQTKSDNVKSSWVPVLKDMDVVKDLNWPKYLLEKFVGAIRKTLTIKTGSMNGCILYLIVSFYLF